MTYARQTITGELRKWHSPRLNFVKGYVYDSDIWDEGEEAYMGPGTFIESALFYLFVYGNQVYKCPKDEQFST